MKRALNAARLALASSALLAFGAAQTEAAVLFVASDGVDTRACTRELPCRQLQRAVNLAADGDAIQIVDAGEYSGVVNIAKSVTISAQGVSATLTNMVSGFGLRINGADAVVTLRGLTFSGVGAGVRGLTVQQAAAVHIEDCRFERFTHEGILVTNSPAEVFVSKSMSRLNGGRGLSVVTNVASRLTIQGSHFENNGAEGIYLAGNIEGSISDSYMSGNASDGIRQSGGRMNVTDSAASSNGADGFRIANAAEMTLEGTLANFNTDGFYVGSGTTGRISNSVFEPNSVSLRNFGRLETRVNNAVLPGHAQGRPLTPIQGQ